MRGFDAFEAASGLAIAAFAVPIAVLAAAGVLGFVWDSLHRAPGVALLAASASLALMMVASDRIAGRR